MAASKAHVVIPKLGVASQSFGERVPGETNTFRETVIVNLSFWTSDVLTLPATSRQPLTPLGSHSHGQFVQALKDAVALLEMGGASRDQFQKQ